MRAVEIEWGWNRFLYFNFQSVEIEWGWNRFLYYNIFSNFTLIDRIK